MKRMILVLASTLSLMAIGSAASAATCKEGKSYPIQEQDYDSDRTVTVWRT